MLERTFNAGVKVDQAIVERKDFQYLYPDGDDFVFMDLQTYDQTPRAARADRARPPHYLVEGGEAQVATARRRADLGRPAGVAGAHDHEDRPRGQGRHAGPAR